MTKYGHKVVVSSLQTAISLLPTVCRTLYVLHAAGLLERRSKGRTRTALHGLSTANYIMAAQERS
jgi:hypothetical protein